MAVKSPEPYKTPPSPATVVPVVKKPPATQAEAITEKTAAVEVTTDCEDAEAKTAVGLVAAEVAPPAVL